MTATFDEKDYEAIAERLKSSGYARLRATSGLESMMSAVDALGRFIGAHSYGHVRLQATESSHWLGRHTESLTDGPPLLRYFALGCLVPAAEGGATLLYDGCQAASLLSGPIPRASEVRIRYRSAHRPDVWTHPLIVMHERHGQVLRFRSACDNNTVIAKPVGLSEADIYEAVEEALSASVAYAHTWRVGDLLIVDNHRMLHSRAPFMGPRHMLRVRYDDPLHRTVILGE